MWTPDNLHNELWKLPEPEQHTATMLAGNLIHLYMLRQNIVAAAGLLVVADENLEKYPVSISNPTIAPFTEQRFILFRGWKNIAMRDGAMTIFHFGKTLEASKQNLGKCSTLDTQAAKELKRQSGSLFNKHFGNIEDIRDAIAHNAENSQTLEALDRHMAAHEGGNTKSLKMGEIKGNSFTITKNKSDHTFELSMNTANRLSEIGCMMYDAIPQWKPHLPPWSNDQSQVKQAS